MLYSTQNSVQPISDFEVSDIKDELKKPRSERNSAVIFDNTNISINGRPIRYFLIFPVNYKTDDAVIIELDYETLRQKYIRVQKELNGQFLVYFDNVQVLFGGNDFSIGKIINNSSILKLKTSEDSKIITYNNAKTLISH